MSAYPLKGELNRPNTSRDWGPEGIFLIVSCKEIKVKTVTSRPFFVWQFYTATSLIRVSQACLGKSTSFILDIHNMVNWQLSKQDSHWPYRGLICQLIEVTWFIWKLPPGQLIVLLDRDQCSISYFLASLGAQLIMQKYWTSMLWSIDSCHTGYPLTSITWAYRRLRCRPIEIKYFLKLSADKLLFFKWSQA